MGRLRRSRVHRGIRDNQRKWRTRARTKDIDQILHEDLKDEETRVRLQQQPVDTDKPGLAQHYCVECA